MLSPRSIEIAFEHVDGNTFELFAKHACADLFGTTFIPLGGMHDGGADGFDAFVGVYESTSHPTTFFQISIQDTYERKITDTSKALKKSGRNVRAITYITSLTIPFLDKAEQDLSDKLDLRISIRDRQWLTVNINRSAITQAAGKDYLLPALGFLSAPGSVDIVSLPPAMPRAIAVFLGQEIERRRRDTDLLEGITDTLILWALEDTVCA